MTAEATEFGVHIESLSPEATIIVTESDNDQVEIVLDRVGGDAVTLLVGDSPEFVEVPGQDSVDVHVDSFETIIQIDDVPSGPRGETGQQGPQGPQGPPGPAGLADPDTVAYRHVQSLPSDEWIIDHGRGWYPGGVVVLDSAGSQWEGDLEYPSIDTLIIRFSASFSGVAILS